MIHLSSPKLKFKNLRDLKLTELMIIMLLPGAWIRMKKKSLDSQILETSIFIYSSMAFVQGQGRILQSWGETGAVTRYSSRHFVWGHWFINIHGDPSFNLAAWAISTIVSDSYNAQCFISLYHIWQINSSL